MLAKTNQTLLAHTLDVVAGCENVIRMSGHQVCKMFRIKDVRRFNRLLMLAAWFHDIGKANSHFQRMIKNAIRRDAGEIVPFTPQAVRHEAISFVYLQKPEIWRWLGGRFTDDDLRIVSLVVAGHHRKFAPNDEIDAKCDTMIKLHWNCEDVQEIGKHVAQHFELTTPPQLEEEVYVSTQWPMTSDHVSFLFDELDDYRRYAWDDHDRRLIASLKLTLIQGDVLGSIQGTTDSPIYPLVNECLSETVSEAALQKIIEERQAGRELYPHQMRAGLDPERVTCIQAGCGSGKTIYGYQWASRKAIGRKLYFCYPTMGSTTAGYLDYLKAQGEGFGVYHSTSHAQLMMLASGSPNSDSEHDSPRARDQRLLEVAEAFRVMPDKIIACTADTVLGIFHYYRHSVMGLMSFANGAFIFDEIHSYDDKMWKTLLEFIQLDVPCLLMTATLPAHRLEELQAALGDERLGRPDTANESEELPRYHKQLTMPIAPDDAMNLPLLEEAKVLWISNSVDTCIQRYLQFRESYPHVKSYCYHARFKIRDRETRQKEIFDAFRGDEPVVVFATQIAEMSLDISADVLISDVCPITSLIQRLGRLNRDGQSRWGYLYVCDIESSNPYDSHEVDEGREWAERIPIRKLSQREIDDLWRDHEDGTPLPEPIRESIPLLDNVVDTQRGQLRLTEGWNVSIILPEDVDAVEAEPKSIYQYRIKVHLYPSDIGVFKNWESIGAFDRIPDYGQFSYSKEWGAICNLHR